MNNYKLKDGREYTLERMLVSDGVLMIDYLNSVASESDNLTFGSGDLEFTIERQTAFLSSVLANKLNFFMVAKMDGKIIANINFSAGDRPRIKHAGEFGISVLKEFWGNAVATEMLKNLIEWAKESKCIGKINLQVREDNENAIRLYEKFGFENEGLIRRTFLIKGKYYNSYHMGLLID